MIKLIKAIVKNSFTMGGKWYEKGNVDNFSEDQVKRLSHLLQEVKDVPQVPVSVQPPADKMVKESKIKKREETNQ